MNELGAEGVSGQSGGRINTVRGHGGSGGKLAPPLPRSWPGEIPPSVQVQALDIVGKPPSAQEVVKGRQVVQNE